MNLSAKQCDFTLAIAKLVIYAYNELNIELTYGDAYRDPRVFGLTGVKKGYGRSSSCHKSRLAVDFNLFKNGKYIAHLKEGIALYNKLHDKWDTLDGAIRIPNDLNHFSFNHNGRK